MVFTLPSQVLHFKLDGKISEGPGLSTETERKYGREYMFIPERPKGGGHLAAMNCVGELQRDLHQCCGILVKPLPAFLGHLPFVFIFKFLLMAVVSHDLGQLSHPFPLSLLAAGYLPLL